MVLCSQYLECMDLGTKERKYKWSYLPSLLMTHLGNLYFSSLQLQALWI